MTSSPYFTYVLIGLAALVMAIVELVSHRQRKLSGISTRKLFAVTAPSLLMLLLFYSLVGHTYYSLGGWPASIGDAGFPAALVVHADIAMYSFSVLALLTLFAAPVALALSSLVPLMRRWRLYVAATVLSMYGVFGLMLLAPERFLYWWWD